ncbi:MAG: hypothetical protein MUO31_00810 [Thermodesulfovibrionales bacterium]|nr:hypothetical protein [Thermodesulfovibrionales bacterium]
MPIDRVIISRHDRSRGQAQQKGHGTPCPYRGKNKLLNANALLSQCLTDLSVSNRQIELPENDRLKNQLLSLMRRTNPSGQDSVVPGQGDGSHADLANAVAGAVWLANEAGGGEGPRAGAVYGNRAYSSALDKYAGKDQRGKF